MYDTEDVNPEFKYKSYSTMLEVQRKKRLEAIEK